MNATIQRDYAAMRAKGWAARESLWYAKAKAMLAEHDEDIRIRLEPDDMGFDIGDMFTSHMNPGVSDTRLARMERDFFDKLSRNGVWGFIVEYRVPSTGEWEHSDSCWGFDDEELCREYALDAVPAAVEALLAARANVCPMCGGTGKRGDK